MDSIEAREHATDDALRAVRSAQSPVTDAEMLEVLVGAARELTYELQGIKDQLAQLVRLVDGAIAVRP